MTNKEDACGNSGGTDVGRPDPIPKLSLILTLIYLLGRDPEELTSVGSYDHERAVCVSPAPKEVRRSFLEYADSMSKIAEIRAKSYAAALEVLGFVGNHVPGVREVSMDQTH